MTKTEDNPMHLNTGEPSRLRQAPRDVTSRRLVTIPRPSSMSGSLVSVS
jgi:hypothetical protein